MGFFDKRIDKISKKMSSAIVKQNYEIFLSGINYGKTGLPYPSLKEFCKTIKSIHEKGKKLSLQVKRNGERINSINAPEKSN